MRIGIVGTENSHADGFVHEFNIARRLGPHRVTALADGPAARNRQLAHVGGIDIVVNEAAELIGQVDAVIVCARDGRRHRDQTLPLLAAGLPVFVDKPFANDPADASAMLVAARRAGVALTSFSPLRFAPEVTALAGRMTEPPELVAVAGPANAASEYGGLHFYGVHVVEIARALVGAAPLRELAVAGGDDAIVCTARAGDTNLVLEFVKPYPVDSVIPWRIATAGRHGTTAQQLQLGPDHDLPAAQAVVAMLETGHPPLTEADLLASVATMAEIADAVPVSPTDA